MRFHDLRYTFASRLVKKGVGPTLVVIALRYSHSQPEEKRQALETLGGQT